ncbi:MAG TPA: G1 family glutamic endopeptidase [Streptosporangiaceae bacterium]|nr:G1 family glutamic endopeptidase [Streptosporangiaceae bacterium]
MRRLIRCLAYSAACSLLIAGIAGFAGRAPEVAVAQFSGHGGGRPGPPGHAHSHRHPHQHVHRHVHPHPHNHPHSHPHPHQCGPLHIFLPHHGFKPLHATNAQLLAHGFPPRPAKSRKLALRLWRQIIVHARKFDRPHPACGTGNRSTVYSGNWSGRVVPRSYYGNAPFTAAQAEWVQPAVAGHPHDRNYNRAPAVSLWVGVGVRYLMQAGVDSISTARPRYKFWTEDFPQKMVWEGPAIGAGQIAFVYVRNVGSNQAYYFLENVTTGVYSAFTNPLPYVGADAANFVLERPNGRYLPFFRALNVWDSYFWQHRTSYQLTSVSNRWIMTSDCTVHGTVLARPSDVAGGQFSQTWMHSRPFANSC